MPATPPQSRILAARGRRIVCHGLIMGILNINEDSFSGDGRLDPEWAVAHAKRLVGEGADIIDVGGESARTNRAPISEQEEWRRIAPFLETFRNVSKTWTPRSNTQVFPPLLSVNTWRTDVASRALAVGCDILNDMSALPDATHASLCARHGTALLIMHSKGLPKVAHTHIGYPDIMAELESFFSAKIALARSAGLQNESIILDPGIDFAKQCADNLTIFREVSRLLHFECPILLPVSRKGTIGRVLEIPNPADRDAGTVACIMAGARRGVGIFRVHNVNAAWLALRTAEVMQ